MKRLPSTNEFYVAATIVLLSIIIGSINPAFFTLGNLIDLLRSSIVMGIFGLGVLMVIISGGIDVSFTAIASISMFATTKILRYYDFQGTVLVAFLIAAGIGLALGLINAVFISLFRLPTLIVTLGTASMINGFMLAFIGAREISNIPQGMIEFSKINLFEVTSSTGFVYGLPAAILILAALVVFVWFLLKYTMLGRGIYALGGDRVAAERVGFDINAIQFFIYGFVGLISGVGGLVHTCLMRNSDPVDLMGTELVVIAAVVLGGARITGGHGTVLGTLLGLFLVTIITNSLILLGIPSYWQSAVVGMLILVGTGVTAYQSKRAQASHGLA
ncbi:MAG TPA: ABC transporter permease [Firmicutes bacterium]|nr:ABC transporter permease [Bacillota bacterium]